MKTVGPAKSKLGPSDLRSVVIALLILGLISACEAQSSPAVTVMPTVDSPRLSQLEVIANVQTLMKSIQVVPNGSQSCYQGVTQVGGWSTITAEYLGEGQWSVSAPVTIGVARGLQWKWRYFEETGAVLSEHDSPLDATNC